MCGETFSISWQPGALYVASCYLVTVLTVDMRRFVHVTVLDQGKRTEQHFACLRPFLSLDERTTLAAWVEAIQHVRFLHDEEN